MTNSTLPIRERLLVKPVVFSVIALLLGISAWAGFRMWSLPLWGHLPLAFFAPIWLVVIVWRCYQLRAQPERLRIWGMATLSGLIFAAGFPLSKFTALMFLGFVPLLLAGVKLKATGARASRFYWLSWHSFVVWNILSTYWVANAAFFAAIVAILVNSLFMAFPMWLFYTLWNRQRPGIVLSVWAAGWLSFEALHNRWELSWPWLTIGNAFSQQTTWVQWYEYTGVPGGSLWVLLVSALVFMMIHLHKTLKDKGAKFRIVIGLVLLLPVLLSFRMYRQYKPNGEAQKVCAIQPNYEPHYEKFDIDERLQLDRMLRIADTALQSDTRWLVLPESVIREGTLETNIENAPGVRAFRSLQSRFPNLHLVLGTDSYNKFGQNPPATANALRKREMGNGETLYWEAYNSAIAFDRTGKIQIYHKSKLVPGAEIMPLRQVFFFLLPLVENLGGTMEGVGTQKERTAFGTTTKVAPIICYESVYGDFVRGYVHNGAEALFVMSNDGWWDDTPGYLQHKQFSALRAIETRLDVVRATNTGSSCFIDQKGDIRMSTAYNTITAISDEMLFRKGNPTFYVRYGDLISWIALAWLLVGGTWSFVKRRQIDAEAA